MNAILLIVAIVLAFCTLALAGLWFRARLQGADARSRAEAVERACEEAAQRARELESRIDALQPRLETAAADAARVLDQAARIAALEEQLAGSRTDVEAVTVKSTALAQDNALLQNHVEVARQREAEVRKLLDDAQNALRVEFQNIANAILETKSKSLSETNQKTLESVLQPFNERLREFKAAVEDTHNTGIRERSSLKEQIAQLASLNRTLGTQAQSLTEALRGQAKVRGTWGEHVLTKMLEDCGLREGHEFRTQASFQTDDGKRLQPDVVVNLPRKRFVIIDSKVSLLAYLRYVDAEDEADRASALQEHISSIHRHINDLSKKDYSRLYDVETPDYVLMFVPIEPALMLAMQAEPDLSSNALAKRVSLVSPNTLYAVLHTVEYLWQIERRSKNMDEIRKRGGLLYDAAVRFIESMEKIGEGIRHASDAYHEARKQLTDQSRGVFRQAERLRSLGITHKKEIPSSLKDELDEVYSAVDDPLQIGDASSEESRTLLGNDPPSVKDERDGSKD